MKIKNLIRIIASVIYYTIPFFVLASVIISIFEIKSEWIPVWYIAATDYMQLNPAMSLLAFFGLMYGAAILKDACREKTEEVIDAEYLDVRYYYRLCGNVEERGGDIIAKMDVFGNILGTGNTYQMTVRINKKYFPLFMISETRNDRKIFPGTYLKINWQNSC